MAPRSDSTTRSDPNRAAEALLDHFRILPRARNQDLLWEVGEAFTRLPYENLTKLIRKHEGDPRARRRGPEIVVGDHLRWGTGGTCFALTETFLSVLRRLGYRCRPVMCDMKAGPDTHCAVVIDLPEGPHLMDPGYLLHRPLPLLPGRVATRDTGVAEVRLQGAPDGQSFELHTGSTWRYRMKAAPVSPARFLALWDASFHWGHMNNVHLSRAVPEIGGYAYVHGLRMRLQGRDGKENLNLRGRQASVLGERFGLAADVVERAYRLAQALRESAPAKGEGDHE